LAGLGVIVKAVVEQLVPLPPQSPLLLQLFEPDPLIVIQLLPLHMRWQQLLFVEQLPLVNL